MKKIAQFIDKTNQQIFSVLANESSVRRIKEELTQIDIFAKHYDAYRLIKFSQGILYIGVPSAAFATQIRHAAPEILRELQKRLPNIKLFSVQCKVSTFTLAKQKPTILRKNQTKAISEKTRTKITSLAETLPSEELREALKRLAIK